MDDNNITNNLINLNSFIINMLNVFVFEMLTEKVRSKCWLKVEVSLNLCLKVKLKL